MFNDQIMIMYLLIGINLFVSERVYLSSFFITLALSVKAGVILILPAFLGSIQQVFGTRTLIASLAIILGF